jgi:DNA helicase-2/ATP-dependent DNA helicase PcrA
VLILAGAGSGKTRVITHRIAHLVRERGVPTDAVLAVTFTNKAAGEMKERTERLLEGEPFKGWISTFHSLCVRLLRREWAAAGLARSFVVYDEDDQLALVRDALRLEDLPEKLHPPRRILSRISARKNAGKDPAAAGDDSLSESILSRVSARYAQGLTAANALDFDDLLLRAVRLLDENEHVRESYRRRFRYVLVDEYQDTNRPQYELVRNLVGPGGNVTVVGDEDQSIYSWRGADINNILDFERDFPGARVLRLEENYRSTQAILDAAGSLVAKNQRRKGKTLRAVERGGDPVRLHEAGDEFTEAAWVVERIASGPRTASSAILMRTNAQTRLFEEALLRRGLAYVVVGGVGFYERREVKDVLSYLRLVMNPADPVAFRRVLNVPARGIGSRTEETIARLADERRLTPWDAARAIEDGDLLPARATLPLRRFREMIEGLREEAARLSVTELLTRVLVTTGYSAMLADDDRQESQDRQANLAELISAAADYEARDEAPSLQGFLDTVSLLSDVDKTKGDAPVVLLTFHAAKGLEFDNVFLVGLEEGLVPHVRTRDDPEGLEEERRLCYVGMTRARRRLHLTWTSSRALYGQRRLSEPSRFLKEIDREHVVMTGGAARPTATPYARPLARPGSYRPDAPPPRLSSPAPPAGRSAGEVDYRPGAKVRHPLFGVGTVLRSEGAGDDLKVTVSFMGVGAKRLVARFAGLEEA